MLEQRFAQMSDEERQVLGQFDVIWPEVIAKWNESPEEEQVMFVLVVFRLLLGEEALQEASPSGGATAGGGGCATFEDCAAPYTDGETWTDTNNAMSCWASAGCAGYDAVSNSFDYGDY